MFASVSIVSSN